MAKPPLIADFEYKHETLGQLTGWSRKGDIVQFRGIPYADIPGRFRQSILRETLPTQPFDARHAGPICPQDTTLTHPSFWSGPPPPDAPPLPPSTFDEFHCLNLNITIPQSTLSTPTTTPLPVLVYIHGGAFVCGASTFQVGDREMFDPAHLVRHSMAMGKPIIVVTINYRLGALGFLASRELRGLARECGEAFGNYGLHDQRRAIEWVGRFIAGFGGDAGNVTVEGGSAGGASAHFQGFWGGGKVRRVICNSGTVVTLAALPVEVHQKVWDRFVGVFGGEGEDVVERLQGVDVERLIAEFKRPFAGPVIDGDWIKGRLLGSYLENNADLPEFMMGASAYEQDLTHAAFGSVPCQDEFLLELRSFLVEGTGLAEFTEDLYTPDVLEAYGLQSADSMADNLDAWCVLIADMLFKAPALLSALHHKGSKIYLFEFQATNPFPGWPPGYEKANHALADLFLLASGEDLVTEKHRAAYHPAVRQIQGDWIRYCYGELGWQVFDPTAMGPVYTYENFGEGKKYDTYAKAVGGGVADRILRIVNHACL